MRAPWTLAALTSWPRKFTEPRLEHPFRDDGRHGVGWSATIKLLRKELDHLDAENVVLRIAIPGESIKIDGTMKLGRSTPTHPGVILTFDSMYGPLSYPADKFKSWRANVRAIAISLDNLRRVDRYGVTNTGEQYSGFKQIAATASGGTDPTTLLAKWCDWTVEQVRAEPERAYRLARKNAHPDSSGGNEEAYKKVVLAGQSLGVS